MSENAGLQGTLDYVYSLIGLCGKIGHMYATGWQKVGVD